MKIASIVELFWPSVEVILTAVPYRSKSAKIMYPKMNDIGGKRRLNMMIPAEPMESLPTIAKIDNTTAAIVAAIPESCARWKGIAMNKLHETMENPNRI